MPRDAADPEHLDPVRVAERLEGALVRHVAGPVVDRVVQAVEVSPGQEAPDQSVEADQAA